MNRRELLAGLAVSVPVLRLPLALPFSSSEELYVLHRVSAKAAVNVPVDAVDLAAWVSHLTSEEYVACAPQHHGSVQAALPDGRPVFVSVETIGGNFMSHQYVTEIATRSHVHSVSAATQIWVTSAAPVPMRVTWDVRFERIDDASSELVCDILVETADGALAKRAAQRPANVPNPVQVHCSAETPMFAADIERKARRGVYRG